jgi:prepilin-type N-terminal cleavage/methylation domain-containing protein
MGIAFSRKRDWLCGGFTLIELMITMALVSILLVSAVGGFRQQQAAAMRYQVQALLGEIALSEMQGEDSLLGVQHSPVLKHFEVVVKGKSPGQGDVFWVLASPRNLGRFSGQGALSLTSMGLGCWHRHTDAPQRPTCLPTDEKW